jgi:hypothetical protein
MISSCGDYIREVNSSVQTFINSIPEYSISVSNRKQLSEEHSISEHTASKVGCLVNDKLQRICKEVLITYSNY